MNRKAKKSNKAWRNVTLSCLSDRSFKTSSFDQKGPQHLVALGVANSLLTLAIDAFRRREDMFEELL